jgi:hypothetical protein
VQKMSQLSTNPQQLLKIPLLSGDRELAKKFAAEQATPEKGLQVYLNTISVLAVYRYLNWLQIETDVTRGDCWNTGLRAILDVADLVLPDGQKIECRMWRSPDEKIFIPTEVRRDRLGVMGLALGNALDEVKLVGFFPTHAELPAVINRQDFQSLDVFLETLESVAQDTSSVCLREWLQGIFTEGWEAIGNFALPQTPAFAFRQDRIQRAKVLDFALPIILSIALQSARENKLTVTLQLRPREPERDLPAKLKLQVFTGEGELFREIVARDRDRFLQYEFSGNFGENFSVKTIYKNIEFSESFRI